MAVIRDGKGNHSNLLDKVPERVRQGILRTKEEKGYKLECCHISTGKAARYFVHLFQEILYELGLNGRQEVRYEPGKEIYISPRGTSKLRNIFTGSEY